MNNSVLSFFQSSPVLPSLFRVAEKVISNERITVEDGNLLYNDGSLPFLSL